MPYIFSVDNVKRLVEAASGLGRRDPFRGQTYSTFFALLACTGLRVSEAIKLRFEDVTADGLIIRCSKFRKSRMVPLHSTAQIGLERYTNGDWAASPNYSLSATILDGVKLTISVLNAAVFAQITLRSWQDPAGQVMSDSASPWRAGAPL